MCLEFDLYPLFASGVVLPKHRTHGRLRGVFTMDYELDMERNAHVRVARFQPLGGKPAPEPLWKADLLFAKGDWWRVTGTERIQNVLGAVVSYEQTWAMNPACCEDLARSDRRVNELSAMLHALRQQMDALKGG